MSELIRKIKAFLSLLLLSLFLFSIFFILVSCSPSPSVLDCPTCPQCNDDLVNSKDSSSNDFCSFDVCFSKDSFRSHYYFSKISILHELDSSDCDDAFKEENVSSSNFVCKLIHATPLQETGRDIDGNTLTQWNLDCDCSFE